MDRIFIAIACILALPAFAAAPCAPKSDILVRSDASLAPVRPADCATVTQTPPEFTWPPQSGQHTYTLTLTFPDGKSQSRKTTRNWLLWDEALPPGRYTWRVKVDSAGYTSDPRGFTIAADAVPFVVPSAEAILKRAKETPRPRTWSRDETRPIRGLRGDRGFRLLVDEVENKIPAPVQPEPKSTSLESNTEDTMAEQKRTLAAALAFSVTGEKRYAADTRRRILAQSAWSPLGSTAYKSNDMASRNVAWTLALTYDWMYEHLSAEERKQMLGAIRSRAQPMYEDLAKRMHGYPYDSHGNVNLTLLAAIAVLMAGDLPEADTWVREIVPLAIVWTSPWGGHDGGFGNGTQQLFWDTGSNLPAWYVLRNAAGVDLAKKEWVRNLPRFMAYFVPPGAPSGVFGDGHEMNLQEVWARVSKALARFAPSPLAHWYARSQRGEDPSRIELMMSPRVEGGGGGLPPGTPHGAVFPSVGWAAMHSRLDDPARTSVYFKSSPFGSYNHSHGDQNGFAIHARGERLLVPSGYYDGYRTPHWTEWYKQTRAANAITFDGGKGQGFNDKRFAGEIVRFETTPAFDYVIGRAEKAYDPALKLAQRTLVYLRPDTIIVHDRLASGTPRAWEWNIHALERMNRVNDRTVGVQRGAAKLCLEMLAGPETMFHQVNKFVAPAQGNPPPKDQWHGVFNAMARSTDVEFVVLMRVNAECKAEPSAKATRAANGWQVEVDGKTVTLSGEAVSVK